MQLIIAALTIIFSLATLVLCVFSVLCNEYSENLQKHLELAIRQLKEIKETKKKFDVEELIVLESQYTDLITELIDATEEEA